MRAGVSSEAPYSILEIIGPARESVLVVDFRQQGSYAPGRNKLTEKEKASMPQLRWVY